MRVFLRFLAELLFRFTAHRAEVLRAPGPVLLIPNHTSWLDWLFLGVCLEPDWRFVVSSVTAQTSWFHRKIMLNRRTFPIDTTSPYAVKRMAEHLMKGGRLVLFAEGRLSRTGTLMKLFEGTGFLLDKTQATVITAYIRGADRLVTSPNPNRKLLLPRVSIHFSEALHPPRGVDASASAARTRLTDWLRDQMVRQQFEVECLMGPSTVLEAVVASAGVHGGKVVMQDITQSLTLRRVLAGADLLAQELAALLGGSPERIGVLLPNVNATPIVILALWSLGKAPALLNFSTGIPIMKVCSELAGLREIITSRAFLTKARLELKPLQDAGLRLIFVEDLRERVTSLKRLAALARVALNPRSVIRTPQSADRTAVVLFTSGSEGVPKGVALSQSNLMSNIRQLLSICDLTDEDRIFNCLPLFHSFGLTIGALLPLVRGFYVFLYPSPLHYRVVPAALYDRDCTVLLSTNTFLNGYGRKAHFYDFRSLRYLFAGAEKIQQSTFELWKRKFGVRILEGYGATECSPCLAINTPMISSYGTVGRFLPCIEHRIEPVEGVSVGGRLLVKGPNIMQGYLNADANQAFRARDGWYDTGDIVSVDDGGFVTILGRLKRFAKVSGEMVSLTAVEEALAGAFPQYGLRCQVAVVTLPDADKGERLVAVINEARLGVDEIRAAVRARGLSNLCAPREARFLREIPKLGTGKVNHRELERWVRETPQPPPAS
ncbi:MAG: AMP-binding protein [Verrucomicrobia bacterium]|nr:AMP-binding protein [Verrucomicrobiota bacterium]MBI3870792.1 AMP-binding protein [Verrucomicrobiota bacterium]